MENYLMLIEEEENKLKELEKQKETVVNTLFFEKIIVRDLELEIETKKKKIDSLQQQIMEKQGLVKEFFQTTGIFLLCLAASYAIIKNAEWRFFSSFGFLGLVMPEYIGKVKRGLNFDMENAQLIVNNENEQLNNLLKKKELHKDKRRILSEKKEKISQEIAGTEKNLSNIKKERKQFVFNACEELIQNAILTPSIDNSFTKIEKQQQLIKKL